MKENEINIAKALALLQYEDIKYFYINDTKSDDLPDFYIGNEDELKEQYIEWAKDIENTSTWEQWVESNCDKIESYDDSNEYDLQYWVLTDEEADEKVTQYIEDSIWAFNAEFIVGECSLPYDFSDCIRTYQEQKCEGANDALYALVDKMCGIDNFVEDAINSDGRGHFMNNYNGCEDEILVEYFNETFYIYRMY